MWKTSVLFLLLLLGIVCPTIAEETPLVYPKWDVSEIVNPRWHVIEPASKVIAGPHPSVVRVRHHGYAGSGAIVWANGKEALVATAAHVVDTCYKAEHTTFTSPNGKEFVGKYINYNRDEDWAFFLVEDPGIKPIPMATENPIKGENITVYGYGQGSYKRTGGKMWSQDKRGLLFHGIVRMGDSGGPAVNDQGECVGVVTRIYSERGRAWSGVTGYPAMRETWETKIFGGRGRSRGPDPGNCAPTPGGCQDGDSCDGCSDMGGGPPLSTPEPDFDPLSLPISAPLLSAPLLSAPPACASIADANAKAIADLQDLTGMFDQDITNLQEQGDEAKQAAATATEQVNDVLNIVTTNATTINSLEADVASLQTLPALVDEKIAELKKNLPPDVSQDLASLDKRLQAIEDGFSRPVFDLVHINPETGEIVPQLDPMTGETLTTQQIYWGDTYYLYLHRNSSVGSPTQ